MPPDSPSLSDHSLRGVHTCHEECPCQTGGEPAPDFEEVDRMDVLTHWPEIAQAMEDTFAGDEVVAEWAESVRVLGAEVERLSRHHAGVVSTSAHWWCRECGVFDGPIGDDEQCDVCADAGYRSKVERLVPAPSLTQGVVSTVRYRLSPAGHVMEIGTGEYGEDRELAAASQEDGKLIVDALNAYRGVVSGSAALDEEDAR